MQQNAGIQIIFITCARGCWYLRQIFNL